jgi:hypothetical protein
MNLTPSGSSVYVTGSLTTSGSGTSYLTVTGAGGTGAGVIDIGSNSYLYLDNSQTITNATITLSGSNAHVEDNDNSAGNSANGGAPEVLTLGSTLIIDQTGTSGIIGNAYDDAAGSNIVNDGTINVQSGTLYFESSGTNAFGFTNDGAIVISGGATAYIEPTTFTNGTGTVSFAGAGTLELGSSVTSFTETISGFGSGDAVDLTNLTYSSSTDNLVWTQASGTLAIYNGTVLQETLTLAGTYAANAFALTSAGGKAEVIYATTDEWKSASSGTWTTGSNWSASVAATASLQRPR